MNMRTLTAFMLVLLLSPAAFAQTTAAAAVPDAELSPAPSTQTTARAAVPDVDGPFNYVDFGARGTAYGAGSDQAFYQRYRDLRNGPTLDVLRYATDNDQRYFIVQADHVGYRDQHYLAEYNRFGKLKMSFEWNQIPLYFSQTTATLYGNPTDSDGLLLMPDAIQAGLQNKTLTPAQAAAQASQFDLRLKRSIAKFWLVYSPTEHLDLSVYFRNTTKTGNQPWAGTFGFADAVELPVPLDTRITELGGGTEWLGSHGSVRVGYDGSFFRNNIATLVWDNPLRVTDSPTLGPAQGRESLWPNSDLNAGNISGLLKLPARSQATAYVSLGDWSQNNPLIPFTINSALPTIPLDRATSNADARVTATAFTFNSRPTDLVWVNARFRSYDFDNRTPVFQVNRTVAYDTTVEVFAEGGTSPYSYSRKTFDADVSLTPFTFTAFRAGYSREVIDQTFRTFDTTTENTLRLSVDATKIHWLTLRGVYEYARRTGAGLDEQSLDDLGEQVSLRQFDISDRNSNRFSGIAIVMPTSSLSFNGTVSAGNDERPGTVFGLVTNDTRAWGLGMDYVPNNSVSFGMAYEYETLSALQNSRSANPGPQFNDPTRNWSTSDDDHARTFNASLDLIKLVKKTDIRVSYEYSRAESLYLYGLPPNTTLPPVVQLPTVANEFQRATFDARYHLTPHAAVGLVYWYDQYRNNDYALGPQYTAVIAQPSFLTMGYGYSPYTANTVMGRLTYFW
jgi:MtrB/PioB family decaheme-associated outer membrane protein